MKKSYLRKLLMLTLSVAMVTSIVAGCGTKAPASSSSSTTVATDKKPADYKGSLNVWSFTDELKTSHFIDEFNKVYPNIKINLTVIPMDNNAYSTKLASVLSSGSGAPDVYTAEVSFINRFANLPYYEDLSKAPYNADELAKGMAQYSVDLGRNATDKGIRALSWQATPGGIFYKRSLAKQYFGTDDPEAISKMMTTTDDLIKMGVDLKAKSAGKVSLLAGYGELYNIATGSKTTPWVVNNKLTIDAKLMNYIDQAKTIRNEGIDAKIAQWSAPWAAAQAGNNVFGFVLPTWGLNYVIQTNAPKTKGDWGLAKAPSNYYWGGTWVGMYNKSKAKENSWQFIKFISTNKDFLTKHAKDTGDFVTNLEVNKVSATTDAGKNEFVGGQNIAKTYSEILPGINGKLVTAYDETINNKFTTDLDLYINGKKTKAEFLKQFREAVKTAYPDLDTAE
ncbi:MAG: extracellular solute-binding protein [Clostridiaceae bacterium]|nr:extracellular solute-binding protein [Clostridiaceae bacterium]